MAARPLKSLFLRGKDLFAGIFGMLRVLVFAFGGYRAVFFES